MQIPDQPLIVAIVGSGAGTVFLLGLQQWLMHKANQRKIDFILTEYPPHSHREDPGEMLCENGIRYPKVRFNGGNGR
jgi:hypothetical protein